MWFVFLALTALSGCMDNVCQENLISRIPSAGNTVYAAVSKKDCGATSSYAYRVYLSQSGKKPLEGDVVLLADEVDGMKVFWKTEEELIISYKKARIFKFRNFWKYKKITLEHVR